MFKKKVPPAEQAKAWKQRLRQEGRALERNVTRILREEDRLKIRVKALARQGETEAAIPLVQELYNSRKARARLLRTKVQMDSIVRQIDLQLAQAKIVGAFQQSTDLTRMLNQMVALPEVQATMMGLRGEMDNAGLIAEMADEAFEMVEPEEVEDPDVAIRLVFNEIAREANKAGGKQIQLLEIDPAELNEEQRQALAA